ncbi:MAG: GMP reductase [Candidatus Thermoplasmatota archaeon]|jgi:GMP reductase|nr:GMP reductase [Candidatus Thalassarchaeaceae archaeon]MEC7364796.1 GMP reductase [Candidatus Thermoplasmatota archaeon]MEC7459184.1 GMP reductase [Candidatus Thermoplasmatota archaeon]|tara:strand:+ start:2892 stop:3938 length:1047 start_codon:yes stop_codon:yes gene_type:complete
MRIERDLKLTFDDVLIRPKRSTLISRSDVNLVREFTFRHTEETWDGVPIVAANMDTTGLFSIAEVLQGHKMLTCTQKFYSTQEFADAWENGVNSEFIAVTCGSTDESFELLKRKMATNKGLKMICIDVANGYREVFLNFVRKVRGEFSEKIIIAGNVATREMTEALILAGADIVKVGIGPGSVCTTRKVAGVGYPQLSAISECADAAHGLSGHVMSDGGCSSPGDVAKAFAAGADFVMLGGMLAGHDESGGELIEDGGGSYKSFYGMSSAKAMETHYGGIADHRAPEGKEVRVPYRGPLEVTVQSILGGLRSACSYVGARRIKDLPKCTTFIRVSMTTNEVFQKFNVD